MDLTRWLTAAVERNQEWAAGFGHYEPHPSLHVDDDHFAAVFEEFTGRLKDNYPFFHPDYIGQMLKPAHPAAVVGYLAAMLVNPNNHALDGGPATGRMEKEAVARLAAMFGFTDHIGHLTTSGTIANLEALYVARSAHPGKAVAYSADAHYTHSRMCGVLGVEGVAVPVDATGRMDVAALEDVLATGRVGTVVVTTGTTGTGAVDPVDEVLDLKARHDFRVHVDAAYGGFFTLLAGTEGLDPAPWAAIARCDSVVVDPHKHGLQPYGCGAVLFADPAVARFYQHDSPYTYFTSDDPHLGEISLECSRAGASAAALWLTLKLLPPTPEGLGRVLAAGRRAALRWASLLAESDVLSVYQPPQLDIVTYFPTGERLSEIDAASARVLAAGMAEGVFLSTLRAPSDALGRARPGVVADAPGARVLRSVLMKPESEDRVEALHRVVERLAATA